MGNNNENFCDRMLADINYSNYLEAIVSGCTSSGSFEVKIRGQRCVIEKKRNGNADNKLDEQCSHGDELVVFEKSTQTEMLDQNEANTKRHIGFDQIRRQMDNLIVGSCRFKFPINFLIKMLLSSPEFISMLWRPDK